MADTIRNQIVTRIVTALSTAIDKPSGLTVGRSKTGPRELADLPMLSVLMVRDFKARGDNSRTRAGVLKVFVVRLRVFHASPTGETDELIEPILEWALRTIGADATLKTLVVEGDEAETNWDFDSAADSDYAQADMDIELEYSQKRHRLGSPTI